MIKFAKRALNRPRYDYTISHDALDRMFEVWQFDAPLKVYSHVTPASGPVVEETQITDELGRLTRIQ
ncbi:hypothetical protein C3941_17760 [Kaistia algarum]|uniref:hypothetical protein n=1 Tax=Kaistia algarum TaxID=2083279 RepID=UPI000CE7E96D|nr:hypothetical protein [Kaistia algarum]MCX5516724.1 hypothetical protein [Kaistia algarum]PPE78615.1 hypothetical protein C3941_17760 [Kaistia algarum]